MPDVRLPKMEAVLFVGLQGAGKTTFYQQRFAVSHLRISLDQLKTRFREMTALQNALEQNQDVVIDNTNPTAADRKRYLDILKAAQCRIIGYFFEPDVHGSIMRNSLRSGKERV